jgi:CheY-like chemotaxis protein
MDKESLTRVIEPFFTTKGVGRGTGLGLSMVQGFAEQSGGRLVMNSEKGSGTTIEIWLPVAEVKEESEPIEGELSEPKPGKIQKLVVLAVDDDPLVLMNTAAMLEDLGHTVMQASSGDKALAILNEGAKIDVLITDQAMRHMTGLELAKAIKADWPNVPIVLATGYAEIKGKMGRLFRGYQSRSPNNSFRTQLVKSFALKAWPNGY